MFEKKVWRQIALGVPQFPLWVHATKNGGGHWSQGIPHQMLIHDWAIICTFLVNKWTVFIFGYILLQQVVSFWISIWTSRNSLKSHSVLTWYAAFWSHFLDSTVNRVIHIRSCFVIIVMVKRSYISIGGMTGLSINRKRVVISLSSWKMTTEQLDSKARPRTSIVFN